jgi:hypothetical protein
VRNPLRWKVDITAYNEYSVPVGSIGYCAGDHSEQYVIGAGVFVALTLLHAYVVAHETRFDEDVNNESEKIMLSLLNIMLCVIIASLLQILLSSNPQAKFIVVATAVLIAFGVTMLIIFMPKVIAVEFPSKKEQIKITLDGARLVPTVAREDIPRGAQGMPIRPITPVYNNYLSRSLFPSLAIKNIMRESVSPINEHPPEDMHLVADELAGDDERRGSALNGHGGLEVINEDFDAEKALTPSHIDV